MEKRSKYIISLILILIVLGVGGFFVYNLVGNRSRDGIEDIPVYTPEGEVSQKVEEPEVVESSPENPTVGGTQDSQSVTPTIDNTDVAENLEPSEDMKKVIADNRNDINDAEVIDSVAPSYPSNLIPLYKAKSAADSNDIITQNGNPGWTAQYGSDATVPDIADFYQKLLSSTSGYKTEDNEDTKTIVGTIDNCFVQVTVTPNNPERTGLNDMSNVDIFIERR